MDRGPNSSWEIAKSLKSSIFMLFNRALEAIRHSPAREAAESRIGPAPVGVIGAFREFEIVDSDSGGRYSDIPWRRILWRSVARCKPPRCGAATGFAEQGRNTAS